MKSRKVSKERESGKKRGEDEVRDESSEIPFEVNERMKTEVEELGS